MGGSSGFALVVGLETAVTLAIDNILGSGLLMSTAATPTTRLFSPDSPQAGAINHLFLIIGVIMIAILALVAILLFYAAFRYRRQPGEGESPQLFRKERRGDWLDCGASPDRHLHFRHDPQNDASG